MQERVPRVSVRRLGTVIFPRSAHPLPCTVRSQVVPRLLVLIREGVFVLLYHLYRAPAFHTQHFLKALPRNSDGAIAQSDFSSGNTKIRWL